MISLSPFHSECKSVSVAVLYVSHGTANRRRHEPESVLCMWSKEQHKKQCFPLREVSKFDMKYLVDAGRDIEVLIRLLRCLVQLSDVLG